jgi:hypothetical protein
VANRGIAIDRNGSANSAKNKVGNRAVAANRAAVTKAGDNPVILD